MLLNTFFHSTLCKQDSTLPCQEHAKDGVVAQGREAIAERLAAMADFHSALGGGGHHIDSIKTQKAQVAPCLRTLQIVLIRSCRAPASMHSAKGWAVSCEILLIPQNNRQPVACAGTAADGCAVA